MNCGYLTEFKFYAFNCAKSLLLLLLFKSSSENSCWHYNYLPKFVHRSCYMQVLFYHAVNLTSSFRLDRAFRTGQL